MFVRGCLDLPAGVDERSSATQYLRGFPTGALPPALAAQVFVVRAPTETPTGRYLGVAYLQRLLREPPGEELGACMDTDLDCLGPEEPTRRVAEYLAAYDLLAAPVCDAQGRLLGAVSRELAQTQVRLRLLLPYGQGALSAEIREEGRVFSEEYTAEGILMDALVEKRILYKVLSYRADTGEDT